MSTLSESSWRKFYKAGAICAFLYVFFALFVPFFMFIDNTELSQMFYGEQVLEMINANGRFWWVALQTLVLGTSFFAIITFIALTVALWNVDRSNAIIGGAIAVVIHILFIAYYPVMLALSHVAKTYQLADSVQQSSLEAAATALLAINNAFNPLYEAVFAGSIMFISLAMLKGVFSRKLAMLGILTAPTAIIAMSLWSVIGIGYFWWWLLFIVWFVWAGVALYRLGNAAY